MLTAFLFRYVPEGADPAYTDEVNAALRRRLLCEGRAVVGRTELPGEGPGRVRLKLTLLNPRTSAQDVARLVRTVGGRPRRGGRPVTPHDAPASVPTPTDTGPPTQDPAPGTASTQDPAHDRTAADPRTRPDPLDDPDPLRAGDAAATETLLRAYVRETGTPVPEAGQVLVLDLPASGITLSVPVRHRSATGWHRFDVPRVSADGGPDADASLVAAALIRETTLGRGVGPHLGATPPPAS